MFRESQVYEIKPTRNVGGGGTSVTTIGILGVVHDDELRQKYNLSLEFIKELILEFNPAVICGEVLPNSWEQYHTDSTYRGYWGEPASEYWDLIFPLCEEKKYEICTY